MHRYNILCLILAILNVNAYDDTYSLMQVSRPNRNADKNRIRHLDLWAEVNQSIVLNCSLRVNRDQHVVWHRKYEKLGVHVLTIESETFISDLRIRPIKETFIIERPPTSTDLERDTDLYANMNEEKLTWNLEIRRLKKEDSALYYCVLNSENSYGQIYKLNVLPHLTLLNNTEIVINEFHPDDLTPKRLLLICKYDEIINGIHNQIKWYYHNYKINNSLKNFRIIETKDPDTNTTYSRLYIDNFKHKDHLGKYKCQYKGIFRTVKIISKKNKLSTSNRLVNQPENNRAAASIALYSFGTFEAYLLIYSLILFKSR